MAYDIIPTAQFEKDLRHLDRSVAAMIVSWISQHLEGTDHPRQFGKRLTHNLKQYWRYRIGDSRLFVSIDDGRLILELVTVNHRSRPYR